MKSRKYLLRGLLLGAVLVVLAATASLILADPIDIHLTTYDDWLQAGIEPVTGWNDGLEGLHPGKEDTFRTPQLYVMDELVSPEGDVLDPSPGLIMAWGNSEDAGEITSTWDLVFPVDPDLTGMCVSLTAWPRTGMTSISFSLKDASGVMKGWRWPVGAGGLPPDTATTLTVAASGGPGQAGSTGYWDGGVDLTQITDFEFNESGVAQPPGIPLPNNLPGLWVGQWNYWHDIIVAPCPPVTLDHFSCYDVDEAEKFEDQHVSLTDQFTSEDPVQVQKPKAICVPVNKNGEGVSNPDLHLVCYEVKSKEKVNQRVLVDNQFGRQVLRVKGKMRWLCVPSTKEVLD